MIIDMNISTITERNSRPRTRPELRVIESETVTVRQSCPSNVNPIEWHQSLGLARQASARIFRDGGSPTDAMQAFGLAAGPDIDWGRAVELIAMSIARPGQRRAA